MAKRIISVLLCAILLASSLLLSACGGKGEVSGDSTDASGEIEYSVSVKDHIGNPYTTGIIVNFLKDGKQVAMQAVDANGVAKKTLEAGDYTVELSFTAGESSFYCASTPTLTAAAPAGDAIVAAKLASTPTTITAQGNEYDAYPIEEGCTYVSLTKGDRSYFLFTPKMGGHYVFSVADDAEATIGYHGAPHFVQELNVAQTNEDGSIYLDIKDAMIGQGDGGTTIIVIGVDTETADNCVVSIERTGDAVKTIEDEPWTDFTAVHTPAPYTLPAGAAISEFDLTASTDTYKFVLDEATGFYHLNSVSGPIVLVRLATDSDYIASYKTILDKQGVVKYFYSSDEKTYENFVKRESYSECLLTYIECVDETEGVYPLTEDLMYIIQQNGDHMGWWDTQSPNYRFLNAADQKDFSINTEIAWLLMCCYAD